MSTPSADPIINHLLEAVRDSPAHQSSYWKPYLERFDYSDEEGLRGITGFGNRSSEGLLKNLLHAFGLSVMRARNHRGPDALVEQRVRETCRAQHRSYDFDAWRHANTFELLLEKLPGAGSSIQVGCVLGDGQSNIAANFFKFFPSAKILIDLNFPEVLLSEYLLMRDSVPCEFAVLDAETDVGQLVSRPEKTILLCTPQNAELVAGMSVDLFVNIASMQEMTQESIDRYLRMMRAGSGQRFFYCANRILKILPGGERIEFDKFGWKAADRTLLSKSPVPWHQEFYQFGWPFLRKFDGEHVHAIFQLSP